MTVIFDAPAGPSNIVLLRSQKPTGSGGLAQPLSDIEILVQQGGRVIFDYAKERIKVPDDSGSRFDFYMDDYVESRELTGDGVPEVLFHSGFAGASSSLVREHVLFYDKSKASLADVAPESFSHSGRHGLRWLRLAGRTYAVIADENWPSTTPLEDRCHYCPSPFQYEAYQWNSRTAAFEVYRRLNGKKSYSEASQALDGDWTLIQAGLSH